MKYERKTVPDGGSGKYEGAMAELLEYVGGADQRRTMC